MRAPLALTSGNNHIDLCGLTPGETYQVVAVPMADGQKSRFTVTLSDASKDMESLSISRVDRPESRRFVAQDQCIDLEVDAIGAEAVGADIPMYLSVQCVSCPNEWLDAFVEQAPLLAPNISTTGGVGASSLIQTTLIGGTCFDVTNVTSSGNSNSRGTFTNGAGSINIANGVILCTGNVNTVQGPNNAANASGGFNTNSADDADLGTLTTGNQYDVSKIEFDFKPTASTVQFDFVFGSEEYCEYVNSNFNDVFGFFISGPGFTGNQNIALIPSTSTPVTINNVNHLSNSTYYVNNNTWGRSGSDRGSGPEGFFCSFSNVRESRRWIIDP